MSGFLNALGFLTIIRVPARFSYRQDFSPSLTYFPLIGLILGIMISLAFWGLSFFLPALVAVIMVVAMEAVLTGGLHYDGLADVFDGIFSGRSKPEEILSIMKKSDIGTFGVMAVVLALAFKISLIYYLYQNYSENIFSFLVILSFFSCFGRWSMVYLLTSYKPVKKEGSLAAMFQSASNRMRFLVSTIYAVILFFILVYVAETGYGRQELFLNPGLALVPGLKAMVAFLASLLALIIASHLFYRRLGGINGDVAGAVSQVTEITFLLFSLILVV